MPHHAYFVDNIIRESLVEYIIANREEIFLSYSHSREYGPGIERTGKGPPVMEDLSPGAVPGSQTTHPVGQRLHTWLIEDELRADDLRDIYEQIVVPPPSVPPPPTPPAWKLSPTDPLMTAFDAAINNLRTQILARLDEPALGPFKTAAENAATKVLEEAGKKGLPPDTLRVLQAFVTENPTLEAHDRHFVTTYTPAGTTKPPVYEVIGQQGCGDLTMNLWSVSSLNSPLTPGKRPRLLFLHAEPVASRTYPCLVKWKAVDNNPPCVTIEDMQFNPNAARVGGVTNEIAWVVMGGNPQPVGDQIEFAVSGKPVIRHGKPVNLGRRTRQFTDIRHLLKMSNLNPIGPVANSPGDPGRPRTFFARTQYDDVWFGEAQLLADENLQRAAMECPVVLSSLYAGLGVSVDHLRAALQAGAYREVTDPTRDLERGEFRLVPGDDTLVEIFFQRSTYAWNVIGLDQKRTKIQAFACECRWGQGGRGYKLNDPENPMDSLANLLQSRFGTHDALLFDEGQDVFQKALVGGNFKKAQIYSDCSTKPPYVNPDLDIIIPLKRKRLRACFLFARPRN